MKENQDEMFFDLIERYINLLKDECLFDKKYIIKKLEEILGLDDFLLRSEYERDIEFLKKDITNLQDGLCQHTNWKQYYELINDYWYPQENLIQCCRCGKIANTHKVVIEKGTIQDIDPNKEP